MQLTVYKQSGTHGTLEVPKLVGDVKLESHLLHQVVTTEAANARQPHAHTKTKGEVSGSGIKPWRQKGTGRARVGSKRTPVWIGGGITFGPRPNRNFTLRLPRTMRLRAFQMALARQLQDNHFRVIEAWDFEPKTKAVHAFLRQLPDLGKRTLLVLEELSIETVLAAQNLPTVSIATADSVRTTDLLVADAIVLTPAALQKMLTRAFGDGAQLSLTTAPAAKKSETLTDSTTENTEETQ